MSTSIVLLDQNFIVNDVNIMLLEPRFLYPPQSLGKIRNTVPVFQKTPYAANLFISFPRKDLDLGMKFDHDKI